MADGSLRPEQMAHLHYNTGVRAFHLSDKVWHTVLHTGPPLGPEDSNGRFETDETIVRRARAVLDRLGWANSKLFAQSSYRNAQLLAVLSYCTTRNIVATRLQHIFEFFVRIRLSLVLVLNNFGKNFFHFKS